MKTFKEWIEQHNPELEWDWSDPYAIEHQLNDVIYECGNLDFATIAGLFFTNGDLSIDPNCADAWQDYMIAGQDGQ